MLYSPKTAMLSFPVFSAYYLPKTAILPLPVFSAYYLPKTAMLSLPVFSAYYSPKTAMLSLPVFSAYYLPKTAPDNEELNQSVITTALVFNTEDYITLRSNLSKIETMSDK